MTENPAFFVPDAGDDPELVYAGLAQMVSAPVPPSGSRIYSIEFSNRRERWRATVGEHLVRVEPQSPAKRDPGRVLAIYPGLQYQVVHDGGRTGGPPTEWNMPIRVEQPSTIELFTE